MPYNFTANAMSGPTFIPPLTFTYAAEESGTGILPSDWVVWEDSTLEFMVQTDDMSLQSDKTIEKFATCAENGQIVSETFKISLYSY